MRRTLLLALLAAMAVLGTAVARDEGVNFPVNINSKEVAGQCKVDVQPYYAEMHPGAIVWLNYSEYEAVLTFDDVFNSPVPRELAVRALADTVRIDPRHGPSPGVGHKVISIPGLYKYSVELVECDIEDPFIDVS